MSPKLKSNDAGNSPKRSYKVYVCTGKTIIYIGFSAIFGFRYPLGVLDVSPADNSELLYKHFINKSPKFITFPTPKNYYIEAEIGIFVIKTFSSIYYSEGPKEPET